LHSLGCEYKMLEQNQQKEYELDFSKCLVKQDERDHSKDMTGYILYGQVV